MYRHVSKSGLVIATAFLIPLLLSENSLSQEDSSAFIDPFNPKASEDSGKAKGGGKSIFPKLPVPKMPNLNPFSKRQTQSKPKKAPNKPNMFQQIGTGTKTFFTKTTHTLMPWTKPKPKMPPGSIVPAFMQQEKTAEKKKGGIQLMNFFQPDKPKKKIESTSDFFKRERPGFRK